jgi:ribosome recycling factor
MSTQTERNQWVKDIEKVSPGATGRINKIRKQLNLTPYQKAKGASNEDQFTKENNQVV